jgi:UDP-N-acetylmuramyl pentapeptide synthase
MGNRVYINHDRLIEIEVVGDQTPAAIRLMGEEIRRLTTRLRAQNQPVLVLDNLKRLGVTTPECRREVAQLVRTLDYDRVAMLGNANIMMRHGTNLMLRAIGQPRARFFASRAAAYIWLGLDSIPTGEDARDHVITR